ncbi:MAG: glucoamylase family protein [Isosphaeraceae bacterium]
MSLMLRSTDQRADSPTLTDEQLHALQETTLHYYLKEVSPENGLIGDSTRPGSPCSIAAVGMALASAPAAAERQFRDRESLARWTLKTLRFFADSRQGTEPDATGYKGFYYHFLDMHTGRRVWNCEVSTIDSAFLFAGMLAAATYFDRDDAIEREIVTLANRLYQRADWNWARDGQATVTHGWRPEHGFLRHRWFGYDESLLLHLLGLGSPSYPLPPESYKAYVSGHHWKKIYGYEYLYSGPLFTHQLSHIWIDFRGIQDSFMREHGIDYFENSRRATYVHQQYAIRNPLEFEMYGKNCWGITASDGPGAVKRKVKGIERQFYGYIARGAPYGPDDGTIAPWAVVASLPFAPEIVIPTIQHFSKLDLGMLEPYGFKATFNRTFPVKGSDHGWVAPYHIGIDQGPVGLMIENYRSGFLWKLMRRCPVIIRGLRRAGFTGGWL